MTIYDKISNSNSEYFQNTGSWSYNINKYQQIVHNADGCPRPILSIAKAITTIAEPAIKFVGALIAGIVSNVAAVLTLDAKKFNISYFCRAGALLVNTVISVFVSVYFLWMEFNPRNTNSSYKEIFEHQDKIHTNTNAKNLEGNYRSYSEYIGFKMFYKPTEAAEPAYYQGSNYISASNERGSFSGDLELSLSYLTSDDSTVSKVSGNSTNFGTILVNAYNDGEDN